MARITDVNATTNQAWAQTGDQLPLTAVCNPDGSPVGASSGSNPAQTASFTDPGTPGTKAQTIQGNANGIPVPVSNAAGATAAKQDTMTASLGAPSDAAYSGGATATIIAALKGLYVALLAATPAGNNKIGSVDIASALPAGANSIGAVTNTALTSLDNKTPALKRAPLVEGFASITAASTAQTANNTTTNANAVTIMPANAAVLRRRVQNVGTATIWLRCNPTGDTTPAFIPAASGAGSTQAKQVIALAAGAVWESPVDEDCTGLVSVCSATAGQTVGFSAS